MREGESVKVPRALRTLPLPQDKRSSCILGRKGDHPGGVGVVGSRHLGFTATGCDSLGNVDPSFSEPQFPHLSKGHRSSPVGLW